MKVTCPFCKATIEAVVPVTVGQHVDCPKCGRWFAFGSQNRRPIIMRRIRRRILKREAENEEDQLESSGCVGVIVKFTLFLAVIVGAYVIWNKGVMPDPKLDGSKLVDEFIHGADNALGVTVDVGGRCLEIVADRVVKAWQGGEFGLKYDDDGRLVSVMGHEFGDIVKEEKNIKIFRQGRFYKGCEILDPRRICFCLITYNYNIYNRLCSVEWQCRVAIVDLPFWIDQIRRYLAEHDDVSFIGGDGEWPPCLVGHSRSRKLPTFGLRVVDCGDGKSAYLILHVLPRD